MKTMQGIMVMCAALAIRIAGAEVSLTVNADKVVNKIDEKVYGHFLEHIYHSCNGGLWGDMIWNRSFEEKSGSGQWRVKDGTIEQHDEDPNVRLVFGEENWGDYEFTLEARKIGGAEGFLVMFRVKSPNDFYWMNFGGWGNTEHGLERGVKKDGRWKAIKRGAGSIETGRWHTIRVRCEGRRYQVWLDDKQALDFTDDAKAHLTGKVGIGTWQTRAQFRNLKVAALDGKTLFEGLPAPGQVGFVRHWRVYGTGEATVDHEQPLNSDVCIRIASDGGETGLEQAPLCIRKRETYRGSLWARGQAAEGLVVRVLDGQKALFEKSFPGLSAEWKEYPFEFKAKVAAEDAAIRVATRGKAEVKIDQVSLMPESARAADGCRPDLLKAIADLRPPLIRWPGGCYAERYRWKDGIGPQHKRGRFPASMWDDVDSNSYGTDEFIAMCRRVGVEPLVVINIGRHDRTIPRSEYIREACEWMEYCNGSSTSKWGRIRAENGHLEPYNVKYWEVDNETWGMTAEAYSDAVLEFVPEMKKTDPEIKVLACGSSGYGTEKNGLQWNRIVLEKCADLIDCLSIHHYENPNNFAEGPLRYEAFFLQTRDLIGKSKNPNVQLFVSEWNAQSTDWRTGLYCGGILNAFERCGECVGIASPALWLRHVSADAWDNAFINFDHKSWFPAPNYTVMKLWRDHYAPNRIEVEGNAAPLNVVATRSGKGDRVYFKAVNPSSDPVDVKVVVAGGFNPRKGTMLLVAPGSLDARNTLDQPDCVRAVPARVALEGGAVRFTLPAISAGVATIQGAR